MTGYEQLNHKKGWGEIAKSLGYTYTQTPHVKAAYLKIVQPFDDFYTHVKTSPMSQMKYASHNMGSPLTPLPGDLQPPPSTTNKSQSGNQDFSATPSRIVGNAEKLGSPVRPANGQVTEVFRPDSDGKEQSRLRNGYAKSKSSSSPEGDQVYTKELDEVETAVKVPSIEPSDSQGEEAQVTGQKRKRRTDGSCELAFLEIREHIIAHLPYLRSHARYAACEACRDQAGPHGLCWWRWSRAERVIR